MSPFPFRLGSWSKKQLEGVIWRELHWSWVGKAQTLFSQMLIVSQHFHIFGKNMIALCFFHFFFKLFLGHIFHIKWSEAIQLYLMVIFQSYRSNLRCAIFYKIQFLNPQIHSQRESRKKVITKHIGHDVFQLLPHTFAILCIAARWFSALNLENLWFFFFWFKAIIKRDNLYVQLVCNFLLI